MTYMALYREWRPQRFADVVGQEHVVQTLRNALLEDRVAHAYLFAGPRGTGKTSVAKILAKAVNCHEPQEHEPCNQCSACRSITEGSSLDVLEMDAASNRGIEEIRDLREGVGYAPAEYRRKVYIIDEVHMLTTPAFNALLKTLEEPPGHVLFVLATTEPQKVPTTITSRCQRFRFHRLALDAMVTRLEEVCQAADVDADPQVLRLMARHADGSLRDALGILDQVLAFESSLDRNQVLRVLGKTDDEHHLTLSGHLADGNTAGIFAVIDDLFDSGGDLHQFLLDFLEHLRLLLRLKVVPDAAESLLPDGLRQPFLSRAEAFSEGQLLTGLEHLAQAEQAVKWSEQPRILLEVVLVELAARFGGASRHAVSSRQEAKAAAAVERARAAADDPAQERTASATGARQAARETPVDAEDESLGAVDNLQALRERWPAVVEKLAEAAPDRGLERIFTQGEPVHWDRRVVTVVFDEPGAKGQAAEAAGHLEDWLRRRLSDDTLQVACLLRDEAADLLRAGNGSVPKRAAPAGEDGQAPSPTQAVGDTGHGDSPAPPDTGPMQSPIRGGAPGGTTDTKERPQRGNADDLFLPEQARRPTAEELRAAREHPAIRRLLDEFNGTLVAVVKDRDEEDGQ